MRHSTFNMRTICLLAVLSGITVLSAQTPGKPRVQTSAAPEETTVYKPDGKKQETAAQQRAHLQPVRIADQSVRVPGCGHAVGLG